MLYYNEGRKMTTRTFVFEKKTHSKDESLPDVYETRYY